MDAGRNAILDRPGVGLLSMGEQAKEIDPFLPGPRISSYVVRSLFPVADMCVLTTVADSHAYDSLELAMNLSIKACWSSP